MIAALASSSKQKPTATSQMAKMSSAQIKRKRSKLLDLLLNTNWSKQAQQATNLMKLNKILLACDANFIDEKSGESPITLVICSPQLNPTNQHNRSNGAASLAHSGNNTIGCSQSASLFNLQCNSSASHNQLTLKQTSAADICQSSAPLVERILLLLIKSGAQVDFRNKDDQTPLHVAALKSNFWALKTLLDLGASTDYRDINGLTPLYYSILHRAELKITQLLLNYNRRNPSSPSDSNNNNIGITDQHGWQEVHQACKLGLDAHLDKLLYYGCDINAKISGSGNTPLHVAAINDQVNCAKVLLLRGADKTITNNSHQTAHQVAVISNNMDLAEFIAEHDETKVVPFNTRPVIPNAAAANFGSRHSSMIAYGSRNSSSRFSTSSSSQLVNLHSIASSDISQASVSNQLSLSGGSQRSTNTGIVQPQPQYHQQHQRSGQLNPLSLDVPIHLGGGGVDCGRMSNGATSWGSSAPSSHPASGTQAASQSLLSINTATTTTATTTTTTSQQLNVQVNNISPCLSQRSCATSTNTATTSSSGVCCDGEGNNSAEELAHSQSRHSNITIISIGNNVNGNVSTNNNDNKSSSNQDTALSKGCARSNTFEPNNGAFLAAGHPGRPVQGACNVNNNDKTGCVGGRANACDNDHTNDADEADRVDEGDVDDEDDGDDDDDLRSSESSSNGLYSLMSDERPLFAGSIVQATSEYQSGDPNHLQLHRGDLMEVLEYPADLIQGGQLPRLANKPLLFGRRQSDSASGLFPSFCVRRHKQRQSSPRQRIAMTDLTNCNHQGSVTTNRQQQQQHCGIRGTSLPDSQSMAALDKQQMGKLMVDERQESGSKFRDIQVTLNKFNEGFGFVLRGARIDPATLAARSNGGQNREVAIDENLMAANNLASLQYLDDIEPGSVAHKAGLKRGDFLVAVNGHDVRLSSHEQVVNMIRRSGDRVHITIATAVPLISNGIYSSKTLNRIKPEPPKRDPTTTLTRNKTQRIKSMPIAPQPQHQPPPSFDANKPLPQAPADAMASPTGSLNLMGRSISTNLSHFHSAQSLSSGVPDTQSISSISTISSNEQHQNQFNSPHANGSHQTMNESSSSTTTLTTVATTKPKAPAKPNGIHLKAANLCTNDASSSEPTYHPAVITTNLRTSPTNMNSPKKSPAKAPTNPVTSSANPIQNNAISTSTGPPAPPPPPPPPPLPDFSVTPTKDRLNQRRTSAPINQSAELIERSRLLRKRESLAVVGTGGAMASGGGSTQMSDVAAACAAAANNRLQRQRQRELEESTENHSDQTPVVKPDRCQPTPVEVDNTLKPPVANGMLKSCTNDEAPINSVRSRAAEFSKSRPPSPVKSQEPPILVSRKSFSGTQTMSASLGRRASAQIIQQPKPGYMSQTLKPKSKRPPIPSYEDMPPPPPPLPASLPEQEPTNDRIKSNEVQPQPNYRHHHHHHHDHHHHHQQQVENQSVKVNRQSQDLSQLKQQQQLQIRQQQFRQQQMLLQQQQHQHQQQQHHHHHNHHVHQPSSCQKSKYAHDGQCYNATIARSRFSHELVEPTQVQPQLHHHQNAQPSATRSSTQHRHHHHHHHGHHHHQPEADIRTMQRQQYVQTVQHPGVQSTPHSQSSHLQNSETNYHNHHPQQHVHAHQLHHHHQHQNHQQQHLYQQLQQQQFIERYLPLVYSTDSYAATLER